MKKPTPIVENERLGCWGFYPDSVANDLECEIVFLHGSRQRLRVYETVELVDDEGERIKGLTLDQATTECLVQLQLGLELAINAVIAANAFANPAKAKAA